MNGCEMVKCRYWDKANKKCTDDGDPCIYNAHPGVYKEIDALRAENDRLRDLLEDVVNELDLSDEAIVKHGPDVTPPAELVRLVLAEKDRKIAMLTNGMKALGGQQ